MLSDWVFANKKVWQDELIELAFDAEGLDLLVHQSRSDAETFSLDEDCGRDTLRRLVFDRLLSLSDKDGGYDYCALLYANGGHELKDEFLKIARNESAREKSALLFRMFRSGAADTMQIGEILALIESDNPSVTELGERVRAIVDRFSDKICDDEPALQRMCRYILDGTVARGLHADHALGMFLDIMSAYPFGSVTMLSRRQDFSVLDRDQQRFEAFAEPAASLPILVREVVGSVLAVQDSQSSDIGLAQDKAATEIALRLFGGRCWAEYLVAVRSVGAPSSDDVQSAQRMFDETTSGYTRARYARLKRGSVQWWYEQLSDAGDSTERRMFWAVLVLAWTSPAIFEGLRAEVEAIVDALSSDDSSRLMWALRATTRYQTRRDRRDYVPDVRGSSHRFIQAVVLGFRLAPSALPTVIKKMNSPFLAEWMEKERLGAKVLRLPTPETSEKAILNWLRLVRAAHASGAGNNYKVFERSRDTSLLSPRIARKILTDHDLYPPETVSVAREIVMSEYDPETLTTVAASQDWSFE